MGKRVNLYTAHSVQLIKESSKVYDIESNIIRSPDDAYEIFTKTLGLQNLPNENFVMLSLTTKNQVVGVHYIFVGTINASVVSPREIFQRALLNNATSIIVAHNHPSGSIAPSVEDIEVTERLILAGRIMGIELLDHLIIGDGFISMKEKGYFDFTEAD